MVYNLAKIKIQNKKLKLILRKIETQRAWLQLKQHEYRLKLIQHMQIANMETHEVIGWNSYNTNSEAHRLKLILYNVRLKLKKFEIN